MCRRLLLQLSGEKIKKKYPQLTVSYDILDYDAAAVVEATLINGQTHKYKLRV